MSLKPYPKYKDSGVESLGAIPVDWDVLPIRRYVTFKNGADYKHVEVEGGGYPVIGSGGEFRRASEYMYDGESVLFGRKGTVDKPIYVNGKFWTVDTMYYTTVDHKHLLPRFLYYWALRVPYSYYVTSTALPSMTQTDLGSARIGLPSLDDQRAITDYLDRETAEIDMFIADQEELIGLLNERRAATITQAVTKGLDLNASMKESGFGWLTTVPRTWMVMPLKRNISYITSGSRDWASLYADEGTPFVRIGNLTRGHLHLDMRDTQHVDVTGGAEGERSRLHRDDVLFSITAYLGSVGVVDKSVEGAFISQHVSVVRPIQTKLTSRFLGYCVLSDWGQRQLGEQAYGGTKVQLSLADIKRFHTTVPPVDEQLRISGYLDREVGEIDQAIEDSKESIRLSKERRSALISAAVTGKIDVRGYLFAEGAA